MANIKEFIMSIPEEYKGIQVISNVRKEFYILSMNIRLEKILIPQYEKILKNI